MAGPRLTRTETSFAGGYAIAGLPLVEVLENGNIEQGDEWALFRLTDAGLSLWREGAEFASNILSLSIADKPAAVEILRFKTEGEAAEAREKLSSDEKARTLVRSVRPKEEEQFGRHTLD